VVRLVRVAELADAVAFHDEYLGETDLHALSSAHRQLPYLFIGCFVRSGGTLVGLCIPASGRGREVSISGIAVRHDLWRQHLGTRLLRRFEREARGHGISRISVGSAGGYVERFYLSNGYRPAELYIYLKGDRVPSGAESGFQVVRTKRRSSGGLQVNVRVRSYDPSIKERAKLAFDAVDVGYVFEERLEKKRIRAVHVASSNSR
jgi:GNAT superfamily N-acetyltransferase